MTVDKNKNESSEIKANRGFVPNLKPVEIMSPSYFAVLFLMFAFYMSFSEEISGEFTNFKEIYAILVGLVGMNYVIVHVFPVLGLESFPEEYKHVGKTLKVFLERKNVDIPVLASTLEITSDQLLLIFKSRSLPTTHQLVAIAAIFSGDTQKDNEHVFLLYHVLYFITGDPSYLTSKVLDKSSAMKIIYDYNMLTNSGSEVVKNVLQSLPDSKNGSEKDS